MYGLGAGPVTGVIFVRFKSGALICAVRLNWRQRIAAGSTLRCFAAVSEPGKISDQLAANALPGYFTATSIVPRGSEPAPVSRTTLNFQGPGLSRDIFSHERLRS